MYIYTYMSICIPFMQSKKGCGVVGNQEQSLHATCHRLKQCTIPGVHSFCLLLGVWCRQFGTEVIPPKRVLKLLPDLFTHADEKVRAMAKAVAVELTKWIGKDAVKRLLLADLRPATVREGLGTGVGVWGQGIRQWWGGGSWILFFMDVYRCIVIMEST